MATSSPPNPQAANLQPGVAHHRTPSAAEEEKEMAFGQVWKEAGTGTNVDRPDRPTTDGTRRKSSVAFTTAGAQETLEREASRESISKAIPRRISSPPPPPTYHRGISFDTFDNKDVNIESFTLQYKHTDYRYISRGRTFLCGTDSKDYSEYALEWMIEELVDDGDNIICLKVVDKESSLASMSSVEKGKYREEAQALLEGVIKKNVVEQKAISVVLELAVGRVESVIQRMIQLYEPAALIVGTRGRNLGGMQGLLPGSVSKYCLQHSPVPVIVVRPTNKRIKKKQKRLQESGRSLYSNMLEQSRSRGRLSLYDKSMLDSSLTTATKRESEAVAKAIGPRRGILRNPHHGGPIGNNSSSNEPDEPAMPSFSLPIGFLAMAEAPRADLAMQHPLIAALGEAWDDSPVGSQPSSRNRSRSPAPIKVTGPSITTTDSAAVPSGEVDPSATTMSRDNPVFSDEDEDLLGVPKIVEHRRPSTRETTPWLNSILRQPEKAPPGRARTTRSRSRDNR